MFKRFPKILSNFALDSVLWAVRGHGMFLGEDELHLLWGWVFEKGSYPACFSADFFTH